MATRDEGRDGAFNELVALVLRNEKDERHSTDVEMDMRRLLMLARDAHLRDQFVQVQGIRRVTLISKAATNIVTQRLCAGILGNLAHSERGRLGASSCDRWSCVSHRHQCPLSMLLSNMYSGDSELARLSAAALLAFSTQNHCQRHLDTLAGIPIFLRLLDVKHADGDATDVAIYAAAILWNMCKSPALLLKLETIYGLLNNQLTRKLSNLLITRLEPYQLYLSPTGERGMPVLLDFEGENLNILITASVSTQLSVILSVQNYVGQVRSLADQFRPKTPPAAVVASRNRSQGGSSQTGTSTPHYDDSGILSARTCAVCGKKIRVKSSQRKQSRQPSLLCSRDDCGQTYHVKCSRWATLSEETLAEITKAAGTSRIRFFCDACVLQTPLSYWDFLAAHTQHEHLLTKNIFNSIAISRIPPTPNAVVPTEPHSKGTEAEVNQDESNHSQHDKSKASTDGDDEDRTAWPSVMMFDRSSNLVGVGDKCFRIAASSRDPEMFIVTVKYVTTRSYPAARQVRAIAKNGEGGTNSIECKWEVSYALQGALDPAVLPGSAVFWPANFTRDILALEYLRRSLYELENVIMYEFQGEQSHDKAYSIGSKQAVQNSSSSTELPSTLDGLWMDLNPRKGICMKFLAAQLGHLKKLQEVQAKQAEKPKSSKGSRKQRKPHFPGQQLNKVAVEITH